MNIKEIVVLICLWFVKVYHDFIDIFKKKIDQVEQQKIAKSGEDISEQKEDTDHQLLLEELSEEVIERLDTDSIVDDVLDKIHEKYYLFEKKNN